MSATPTGTVTFLFTDIEGSTRLAQAHPSQWEESRQQHDTILRAACEMYRGHVFQVIGDAFCVAFATAPDALAAAISSQRALQSTITNPESIIIRVRMGLHTGSAEARGGEYQGYLTLAHAQRVMSTAYGGQTLVSNATAALLPVQMLEGITLRDMGEHRLKGLLNPEHLWQLVATDLPQNFPPLQTLNAIPNNLPVQLTSFVGREKEVAELKGLLPTTRLLTLTGSGGVGKTRLSLQIAAEAIDSFKDGVWFIELAPLADPALIPALIASALGLQDQSDQTLLSSLSDFYRARTSLLVLDNCEHLIAECARVVDILLHVAPKLTVVASSREALGIAGETAYRVPSLQCPTPPQALQVRVDSLRQFEAARLFLERAAQALTTFKVTEANAPAIAQICSRLDGIPLAIELAAVRVKLLSPEQIAERLDDRFRMLTGGSRTALPRQQTLRAMVDWSYSLLPEAERVLLWRLAVFAGSPSLEAVQVVCGGDAVDEYELLELLAHLVDKSLVVAENLPGGTRYRMLETIRQYAREKLLDSGEGAKMRSRHLNFFFELAKEAEPKITGAEAAAWFDRLEDEYDNLLAALAWAAENAEYEVGLELMTALAQFWYARGHFSQAVERLTSLLAQTDTLPQRETSPQNATHRLVLRARACHALGFLNWFWGDSKAARSNYEQSIAIARELGDLGKALLGSPLSGLAIAMISQDVALAQSLADEGLAIARAVGPLRALSFTLNAKGLVATNRGDYAAAIEFFKECYVLCSGNGLESFLKTPLSNLGFVNYLKGDYPAAHSYYEQALAIWRKEGDKRSASTGLRGIGDVLRRQGEYANAQARYEESLAMRRSLGSIRPIATVLEALGDVARLRKDYEQAAALLTESLALRRVAHHPRDIASSIDAFADLAAAQGRSVLAVRLFGAAENLLVQTRARADPADRSEHDRTVASVRAQLDEATFIAAWETGSKLTLEQAIDLALKETDD